MSDFTKQTDRLSSFRRFWRRELHQETAVLAESGFYATNSELFVLCGYCNKSIVFNGDVVQVLKIHVTAFHNCSLSQLVTNSTAGESVISSSTDGPSAPFTKTADIYRIMITTNTPAFLQLYKTAIHATSFPNEAAGTTILFYGN